MSLKRKAVGTFITASVLLLSGCDRFADPTLLNELKQQQESQQQKIALLEKQQVSLTADIQLLAKAVSNLDARQKAATFTELNPAQTRYFILNNGSLNLAGKITSIEPVNEGSVIHISLVNLLSIPVSNIGFNMTWGTEKPQDKKALDRWQQLLFSTQLRSNIELKPGQWTEIDLTLKGVSPNNLKYLKMNLNMENVIFGQNQIPKEVVKKTKK